MNTHIVTESVMVYENACSIVDRWVNISLKYELTRNGELLRNILDEIQEVFVNEYSSLMLLVSDSVAWGKFKYDFV